MKIALLGATGRTGQHFIRLALQDGHIITAIVRNPQKLTQTHENLKVVEGDVFSSSGLREHLLGQDAVVSCLGFSLSFFSAVTGYTESMAATLNAMQEAKVNRIITMTSWYTDPNSWSNTPFLLRLLFLPMIRSVLTNMYEMEDILRKTEGVDWTVVRPPELRQGPETAEEFLTDEGYYVSHADGQAPPHFMTRGDVARFMLLSLNTMTWMKKAVSITTI